MPTQPYDPADDARLKSESGLTESRSFVAHYLATPAQGTTTAVHAAVTDDGTEQTITTAITNPSPARCVTATAGGTAGDIKAIQVTVVGTDAAGNALTETLPVFTVDTAGTVQGSKAFKTVTSITIPAHDGTGATTAIGVNDKLGLHHKLSRNTVLAAYLDDILETTAATVVTNSTVLAGNTVDINSALDGSDIDVYYLVDGSE